MTRKGELEHVQKLLNQVLHAFELPQGVAQSIAEASLQLQFWIRQEDMKTEGGEGA